MTPGANPDDLGHGGGTALDDRRAKLERLRAEVAAVDASITAPAGEPPDDFAQYLSRTRRFLDELAGAYGYRIPRLL